MDRVTPARLLPFAALAVLASIASDACMGAWFSSGASPLGGHVALAIATLVLAAAGVTLGLASTLSRRHRGAVIATLALAGALALASTHAWIAPSPVTLRFFVFGAALIGAIGAVCTPFATEAR